MVMIHMFERIRPIKTTETLNDTEKLTPSSYRVILHNNDTTPILFVEFILVKVFELCKDEAVKKVIEAGNKGTSIVMDKCSFDEVNKKVSEADIISQKEGYELKLTIEEE
jgi:ATP-dependent Clp protease adaptor protein ClpS